jgi:hypothetical protein
MKPGQGDGGGVGEGEVVGEGKRMTEHGEKAE